MAIPAGVARVVMSGTLYGGEIWSCGFFLSGVVVADTADANAIAADMLDLLTSGDASGAMSTTAHLIFSNQTAFEKVTVYYYGAGGPHASIIGTASLDAPLTGSISTGVPNQACTVISLRTDAAGRRARGRMYMPLTGYGFSATGQLHAGDVTSLAQAWAAFFTAVDAGTDGKAVVVSTVGGDFGLITSVIVDSKADIQRSRAKSESVDSTVLEPVTT